MRKLLLVTIALSLVVVAALPSAVSAQPCNPYNQGVWQAQAPVPTPLVRGWGSSSPATATSTSWAAGRPIPPAAIT